MIKRIGLIRRRADMAEAETLRHWIEVHGPLARRLPGLRRYVQNRFVGRLDVGAPLAGADFDGCSMLCYDTVDALLAADDTPVQAAVLADVGNFVASGQVTVARERMLAGAGIPVSDKAGLAKCTVALARRAGLDRAGFAAGWVPAHERLALALPGLRAATENLAVEVTQPLPVAGAGVGVDAVAEYWFDDAAALARALASPQGAALAEATAAWCAGAAAYRTEERPVVG